MVVGFSTFKNRAWFTDDIIVGDNVYIDGLLDVRGGAANLYGNTVIGGVNGHLGVLSPADFVNNFTYL